MLRTLLTTLLVLALTGCATSSTEGRYLSAARGTATWLASASHETSSGSTWPADPQDPKVYETNLYSGSAGVVLFFLEAYAATGDDTFLAQARCGADYLLAQIPGDVGDVDAGLYTGIAGAGFVLTEAYKISGETKYRDGALRVVEIVRRSAKTTTDGVEWGNVTDIIGGSAGTGLFLLYAAHKLDAPGARDLAAKAGRRLLALGDSSGVGMKWAMSPEFPRLMPNFSHGTAGIAYFLAALYEETNERAFLDAALAGARYLKSIANREGDGCVIMHHEPGGEDLYYLGWCHGPVGTARLFCKLAKVTGDDSWMDWVHRGARSLMRSGIPEKQTPGFWNNVSQCCGSAGVAEFFLALYEQTGNQAHLDFAQRMTDDLLTRETRDGDGLKWIQAEHRVRPELLVAQTGYMQGAAGIGIALLHMDGALHGRHPAIRFPDSPY